MAPRSRDSWEQRRRRLAEWQRLDPAAKESILRALHGAPQRPELSQLELRIGQRRL